MQTFVPYPSFAESARVLDHARLENQRLETLRILQVLTGNRLVSSVRLDGGRAIQLSAHRWHLEVRRDQECALDPAVLMWNGYLQGLLDYQRAMCREWTDRGHDDMVWEKSQFLVTASGLSLEPICIPPWWGHRRLHAAHRAQLLATDPEWYSQFGWTDSPDPEGMWPSGAATRRAQRG